MSSSRPLAAITTGVPQPTLASRGVRHSGLPVAVSNAATNDPPASLPP